MLTLLHLVCMLYSQPFHVDIVNLCHCVAEFHSLQTLTLTCYVENMEDPLLLMFLHPVLGAITAYNAFEHLSITVRQWSGNYWLDVSDVEKHLLTNDLKQALERLPKLLHFELVFEDFKVHEGFAGKLEEVVIRWLPKLKNIVSVKCEY